MKKEIISGFICDNLTDDEFETLRKLKRRNRSIRNPSRYKIIITSEKADYDNLMEYAEYPERGERIGTFYFNNPDQLDLICKAFEGLFYQLFRVDETERMGYGVFEDAVFEDWWNEECCQVCKFCFLRKNINADVWGCRKEN